MSNDNKRTEIAGKDSLSGQNTRLDRTQRHTAIWWKNSLFLTDVLCPNLSPCSLIIAAVFSSVTVSLLALNQGNIWLFEDSVLITGKTSGTVHIVKATLVMLLLLLSL